nr:LuxR C-terminal-related transcriptional regulator [Agromyces seonyuensis]
MHGRQRETAALERDLASGARCISINGRAGVGKTAMLVSLSATPRRDADVWNVDLAGASNGGSAFDEAARRLGLTSRGGAGGVGAIASRIGRGRVVLAVDHSEELEVERTSVESLLEACPQLTIVVTRNEPLELDASTIRLHPLAVPGEDADYEAIREEPSVRLFIDRATRSSPDFRIDPGNAGEIAEICRLVGGLPLAIELAAARVRVLSTGRLVQELRRGRDAAGLDLLSARGGGAQLSIRAALASTSRQLSGPARRLLRQLSEFVGPVPLEVAVALGARTPAQNVDELEELVDLRLIELRRSVGPASAYDLLPIVRAYARESTSSSDEDARRRRAVLAALLREAASAVESAAGSPSIATVQSLRRDLVEEARRIVADEPGRAAGWLADCAATLNGFAERASVSDLLEEVVRADALGSAEREAQARALLWSAHLLALSPDGAGIAAAVSERHRRAVELIDPRTEPLLSLQAHFLGIMNFVITGDLRAAAASAAAGAAEAAALPHAAWAARFEVWLAAAAHAAGDLDGAVARSVGAFERGTRVQDAYTIVGATVILHSLPPGAVPADLPLPSLETALGIARRQHDVAQEGYVLATLTSAAFDAGRFRAAAHWCAEKLAQGAMRGWSLDSEISLAHAAFIAVELGDLEFAARMLGALRADRDRIERAMPPRTRDQFAAANAAVEARFGSTWPALLLGDGGLAISEAVPLAVRWLRANADVDEESGVPTPFALTARELEVLELLADGLMNKEIAVRLGCSPKTVMHHSGSIYRKLGVRGRAEATAVAHRNGLLEPR